MKKINKLIVSVAAAITICPNIPSYAAETAKVGAPVFFKIEQGGFGEVKEKIYEPSEGVIKTELSVSGDKEFYLFSAVYSNDNSLKSVSSDFGKNKTLTSEVTVGEGENYRYFVWDKKMSPANTAPASPVIRSLYVTEESGAQISYYKPDNDAVYTLYKNSSPIDDSSAVVTNVSEYNYYESNLYTLTDKDAREGDVYILKAANAAGESESKPVTVRYGAKDASVSTTQPSEGYDLSFYINTVGDQNDSYLKMVEYNGRECARAIASPRSDNKGVRIGTYYFSVNNKKILPEDSSVDISVTYFDEGTDSIVLQYNSSDSSISNPNYKSVEVGKKLNSGEWKTATVRIDDARFEKKQNLSSDFRISAGVNTYISKVSVVPVRESSCLLYAKAVGAQSISLKWESPDISEKYIDKYLLYRDSELIAQTEVTQYTDIALSESTEYNYEVKAALTTGETADVAEQTIKTAGKGYSLLGNTTVQQYISFVDNSTNINSDSYTEHAVVGGKECRRAISVYKDQVYNGVAATGNRTGMFYFSVDGGYITSLDKNITFEVEYYDKGSGDIKIEYNAADGSIAKGVKLCTRTDTGSWKRASVSVSDAAFINASALAGGSSFRIVGGADTHISEVKAYKPEPESSVLKAEADYENNVSMALNLFEGGSANQDCYVETSEIDGKSCKKSPSSKMMYFDVDNNYMYGDKDNTATISVTFLDSGIKQIGLQYNAADGTKYKSAQTFYPDRSGGWKTAEFRLSDAAFTNAMDAPSMADFRITHFSDDGSDFYLSKITVTAGSKIYKISRNNPTLHLAGDSICEKLDANCYPREGWGMEFGKYFNSNVSINNVAKGGSTTKSFISEGRFGTILSASKPGDYVFIQFGHNDESYKNAAKGTKPGDMNTEGTYEYYLKEFTERARERGITPVFLTSAMERKFQNGVQTDDRISDYRTAMKNAGKVLGVAVIDVGAASLELNNAWGEEGTKQLYCHFSRSNYPNLPSWIPLPDNTHITCIGADELSKIIVRGIRDSRELKNLYKFVDTSKDISQGSPSEEYPL